MPDRRLWAESHKLSDGSRAWRVVIQIRGHEILVDCRDEQHADILLEEIVNCDITIDGE